MNKGGGPLPNRWVIAGGVAVVAIAVIAALLVWRGSPSRPANRAEIETVVHDYILEHPEIIPEAINRLRAKQSESAYAGNKTALETPFGSAWAGAEKGDVTLVMFSDYACGYCRTSVPDVDRLIAGDKKLKVVWREVPILGPGSEIAAKAALAAAAQGKFLAFHQRMFAQGAPDPAKVSAVVRSLDLDIARVQRDAESAVVAAELRNNLDLIGRLDDSVATPTFVVNGEVLKGAVGYDALKTAIANARERAGKS